MKAKSESSKLNVKTERLEHCPNCSSNKIAFWCSGFDRLYQLSDQEFVYSRCKVCDLLFLSVRPFEQDIYKFYPSDYLPHQSTSPQKISSEAEKGFDALTQTDSVDLIDRALRKVVLASNNTFKKVFPDTLSKEIQDFYQVSHSKPKILDFGCGSDRFLNWARRHDWNTLGIDFSEDVIDRVRTSGHEALLMSSTIWDELENESLDCVRMSHVLEHLYQPKEVLSALFCKMSKNAKIHISVPNPCGITSSIFRSRWLDLDCPRHIILFPPKVLRVLLSELGFSNIRIVQQGSTSVFLRSMDYLFSDIYHRRSNNVQKWANSPFLEQLLFIPTSLSVPLGMSARFHIFATKQ